MPVSRGEPPPITVPPAGAPWWLVLDRFALTYNGYDRFDGDLADFANETKRSYLADGVLPYDLHLLRCVLFYEQRRYRHFDAEPEGQDRQYVDDIVELIRELSGGTLPGAPDALP